MLLPRVINTMEISVLREPPISRLPALFRSKRKVPRRTNAIQAVGGGKSDAIVHRHSVRHAEDGAHLECRLEFSSVHLGADLSGIVSRQDFSGVHKPMQFKLCNWSSPHATYVPKISLYLVILLTRQIIE